MAVLTHVHPKPLFHGVELTARAVLQALVARMGEALCSLAGHDYLRRLEDNRIYLQCTTCGHETPGWRIDIAPQRPRPAPTRTNASAAPGSQITAA